jgi:glycosyltransferase involved in cell wall biosynthesis
MKAARGPDGTGKAVRISVIMPTYRHEPFIRRAIHSLFAQTFSDWELIIVDDGSPDATEAAVVSYLTDTRVAYLRLSENVGWGKAINVGLDRTSGAHIAYLPSDDVYHADHLATLLACLEGHPQAVAAFSGVRHSYNRVAVGQIDGESIQPVQVLHRRTADRWLERTELVTDDVERLFWCRLRERGPFVGTNTVSCEWVAHPAQLHRLIREPKGGINPFRDTFRIRHPLRFHSSVGIRIDEESRYRRHRERPATPFAPDGLRIVLAGELAYNGDRVLALEERGHRLYGLWSPARDLDWYNTVGPVPFGHVEDIPRTCWRETIEIVRPDLIYALLNWQAVPFAHHVLTENPGIPFVWHFKEGPFICLERGTWPQLVDLSNRADGLIFSTKEMADWFATVLPSVRSSPTLVLDGDLPKREWFENERSPRLSAADGEIHTVVPGRPIGLHPETVAELARHRIHLHFYGDFTHGQWREWITRTNAMASGFLHLHPHVDQDGWVTEFSRYDAGWLHAFRSDNRGDLHRANWDDLNVPARMATLAAAGLPMIQADNDGSVVAIQSLSRAMNLGPMFCSIDHLATQLHDPIRMDAYRESVWSQRHTFAFDTHADRLITFFRRILAA